MPITKFKIRLGSQQHLTLSGKRYRDDFLPDTYNCRLSLRCGSLQASGSGNFTSAELQQFVNSLVEIVSCLRGECELTPAEVGTFSIRIGVASTGTIVTDVKFATLTSDALEVVGWKLYDLFWQQHESRY